MLISVLDQLPAPATRAFSALSTPPPPAARADSKSGPHTGGSGVYLGSPLVQSVQSAEKPYVIVRVPSHCGVVCLLWAVCCVVCVVWYGRASSLCVTIRCPFCLFRVLTRRTYSDADTTKIGLSAENVYRITDYDLTNTGTGAGAGTATSPNSSGVGATPLRLHSFQKKIILSIQELLLADVCILT